MTLHPLRPTPTPPMPEPTESEPTLPEKRALLVLLLVVSAALAWILLPFYETILWGSIIALLFAPRHHRLLPHLKRRRNGGVRHQRLRPRPGDRGDVRCGVAHLRRCAGGRNLAFASQPQRIADHRHRAQAHRQRRDHR